MTEGIQEVEFDRERFQAMVSVNREVLRNAKVSVEELVAGKLFARMKATVCAHNLAENEVTYPANWWQHFKQRWFPRWALERWPVLTTTERIEIKALYPDMPVPERGAHVLYAHKQRYMKDGAA